MKILVAIATLIAGAVLMSLGYMQARAYSTVITELPIIAGSVTPPCGEYEDRSLDRHCTIEMENGERFFVADDGQMMSMPHAKDEHRVQLSAPVKLRRSFRILCSSVDAGTTSVECGVPVDGGTAGYPIPASSIYVAPTAGSSVKVRVGSSDVTSSTGFEVGTGARDGVGVTVDASGCWCKSEGAAQAADVVLAQ